MHASNCNLLRAPANRKSQYCAPVYFRIGKSALPTRRGAQYALLQLNPRP
jgi:hypothetical protein